MSVEKHRMTALEITMLAHLQLLDERMRFMAMTLQQSLPTVNLHMFTGDSSAQFGNGMGMHGNYLGYGDPKTKLNDLMPGHMPLNAPAIIEGRGPRFVAKYNLARTDEERLQLLATIPKFETGAHSIQRKYLFEEWRRPYGGAMAKEGLAPEVMDYLRSEETVELTDIDNYAALMSYMNLAQYPLNELDQVTLPDTIRRFKTKIGSWQGKEETYVVLVPLMQSASNGYAVFRFSMTNGNGGQYWISALECTFRWSEHELCWTILSAQECISRKELTYAENRLTTATGSPWFEEVEGWHDYLDTFFKKVFVPNLRKSGNVERGTRITFEVPGVLKFVAAVDSNYYSNWEIRGYYDDPELDRPDGVKPSHFSLWTEFNQDQDKANVLTGKTTNVSQYNRAYLKEKLEQFLTSEVQVSLDTNVDKFMAFRAPEAKAA